MYFYAIQKVSFYILNFTKQTILNQSKHVKTTVMKKTTFIALLFILNYFFINPTHGQSKRFKNNYSQRDFEKNKIYDETYHLWKFNNLRISRIKDTLSSPFFVDDRNYKGLINYGVKFKSKDFRNFHYLEGRYMHYLHVDFEKALFNPNDSILEIEGYVSGGWGDLANKEQKETGIENHIDVFLGEINDTIKNCHYSRVVNDKFIEVTLNHQQVDENTILDTFPAFYFKNYSHCKTLPQGRRYFKIKGKIKNNTLLTFGGMDCYSEIFDLSAMVYVPNKNKRKKINPREILTYKTLIINNKLVTDKDKEEVTTTGTDYYNFTRKAEAFILKKQYAKAKEQYLLLDKQYPVLFARDIHNALRCAVLSRDYNNAFYFGEKLAKKGVGINYFNSSVLVLLRRNQYWKKFTIIYDSILKNNRLNFNDELKLQINNLKEEDQIDYRLTTRKDHKTRYETTVRVTDKLIELLKKEGYPSEEKIGIETINDTILNFYPEFNVLIGHARQLQVNSLPKLENQLIEFGKNFSYDYTRNNLKTGINNSCFHIYKGKLYSMKGCGENDLIVKKIKFMFKNPYNFILYNDEYDIIPFEQELEKEIDRYYQENFNFVMKLTDDWYFYEK